MLELFILFCVCLPAVNGRNEHILAIYGNDQSEIVIKDTELRKTLKIFTIQNVATSGITIVYEKDLIFYSNEDGTVYRIHLVDEKGHRKKSGKGKLFTDKDVDHFELLFYETGYPIIDLVYDEDQNMLYIITPFYILQFDPNTDPNGQVKSSFISKYSSMSSSQGQHAVVSRGMLYIANSYNVYNVPTAALGYSPHFSVFAKLGSVTAFAIDAKSTNLYFFGRNAMRVLIGNATRNKVGHRISTSLKSNHTLVVLANGAVTKGVHSMAVYGDVIVWSSCAWKQIYVGKLNIKESFIPMRSVHVLDSIHHVSEDDTCFHNVNLFKHDYDA